jgi:hypothetical protein
LALKYKAFGSVFKRSGLFSLLKIISGKILMSGIGFCFYKYTHAAGSTDLAEDIAATS